MTYNGLVTVRFSIFQRFAMVLGHGKTCGACSHKINMFEPYGHFLPQVLLLFSCFTPGIMIDLANFPGKILRNQTRNARTAA
jgi:hypothetical protein